MKLYSNTGLYPYGKFVINGSRQQLILEQPLHWSRGRPPLDRPPCGFKVRIEYIFKIHLRIHIYLGSTLCI